MSWLSISTREAPNKSPSMGLTAAVSSEVADIQGGKSPLVHCVSKCIALAMACISAVVLISTSRPAQAQNLESALMPGEVIRGHAKYESDCKNCHVRLDRAAQPRACVSCHKEVGNDIRGKAGYHGRIPEQPCRACHTDHKGRDAKIVQLDERTFDHALTDFALRGKHKGPACSSCHRPNAKYSAATTECIGCHRKDDKHKDTLGSKCQNCHDEIDWKKSRFDHSKTKFPLLHRHVEIKCSQCHADAQQYANTPRDCISCHRKDDTHKGRFGPRCEKCHDEARWKSPKFNHDRDTRYLLRDRHRSVKCDACHSAPAYETKTPSNCSACHRKDDVHKNALGEKCESCHAEKGWKESPGFNHDRDTRFPLRDRHREAKCDGCHKDPRFREKTPSACFACHERDDRDKGHKGRYGEKCETCHGAKAWKTVVFVHDRDTRYLLRGKHAQAKCDACHQGMLYRDKADSQCAACHTRDDKHKGQLGNRCDTCHNEKTWRDTSFDHNRSAFPLRDRHAGLECKQCHLTVEYKNAKVECVSCHSKDDRHKERLGPRCEQCHNARSWKTVDFDHNLRSQFKLAGAHVKVACVACHTQPVQGKLVLRSDCASCHQKADDVHLGTLGTQCERCHASDNWRHIIDPNYVPAPRIAPPAKANRAR
jgi:hypothetical protein